MVGACVIFFRPFGGKRQSRAVIDSHINIMGKTYTLDDNGECLAELKAMHEEKLLMRRRLECDEITPDEWRRWHAGYRTRLDEIREAISSMRAEVSRRNADFPEVVPCNDNRCQCQLAGSRDRSRYG